MLRLPYIFQKIGAITHKALFLILVALTLGPSVAIPSNEIDFLRVHTRALEFDFISWTLKALGVKLAQASLSASDYLSEATRKQIVLDHLDLVQQIWGKEYELKYTRRALTGPLAETIIQSQISEIVAQLDLDLGGQPFPPVLYHTTEPPWGLIISPRDHIEQIADISLDPGLTVNQLSEIEIRVEQTSNVSSLAVGIGGIGLYPTMVMETSSMNWLAEVVAHEWVHNFLTLRPLGMRYLADPEMRIINETTASIAGIEIGLAVIERFYPELAPPPPAPESDSPPAATEPAEPPKFDFRAEMRTTRLTADEMLNAGKIEEAEAYMEARRKIFVENGYYIRKLNQAYFAFYGAYADQPGGAAGEDPVGAAVRTLRSQSASLAEFLNRISWIATYEELRQVVQHAND